MNTEFLDFACWALAALFAGWLLLVALMCVFLRAAKDEPLPPMDLSDIRPCTPSGNRLYVDRRDVSAEESAEIGYPEERTGYED